MNNDDEYNRFRDVYDKWTPEEKERFNKTINERNNSQFRDEVYNKIVED